MTIANPMLCAAIGGDNPTPFYLYFPYQTGGVQWIFPYTYNFMLPINPPGQVRVDASQIPPGYPATPVSTALVPLTAYDTPQPFSPGWRNAAASPESQASVTRQLTVVGNACAIIPGGASYVAFAFLNALNPGTVVNILGSQSGSDPNIAPGPGGYSLPWMIFLTTGKVQWQPLGTDFTTAIAALGVVILVPTAGMVQIYVQLAAGSAGSVTARAIHGANAMQAIGQVPMAQSHPVVIASDQTAVPVNTAGQTIAITQPVAITQPINVQDVINGATYEAHRTPNVWKGGAAAVAANGTVTLWTPAAGKKFRLLWGILSSDVQTALSLQDAAGNAIGQDNAIDVAGHTPVNLNLPSNGYLSTTANNALLLKSSLAATIRGVVAGTEE